MRSFRKDLRIASLILIAAFVIAQFFRVDQTNPPVSMDIPAHPSAKAVLKRSCYDCHSNETVWPWYSKVAPFSWMVANDVSGGRKHLNFSQWDSYRGKDQAHMLEEIVEEVEEGKMPLWYYILGHPEAKLKPEDINLLKTWAHASMENVDPKY